MFAVIAYLMDDLVDMVLIGLTKFGGHITIENNFIFSAGQEVGDELGLILLDAIVGRFDVGTGDLFAVVHGHHLLSRIGQQLFVDGYIPANESKGYSRHICPYEG